MLSQKQRDQIESKWDVEILTARADGEATQLTGFDTYCVVAKDRSQLHRPLTLYVAYSNNNPTLMWDVSGFPAWYQEENHV